MSNRPDFRGDWNAALVYNKGDIVYYFNGVRGEFYECLLQGTQSTAPGGGQWRPLSGVTLTSPADAWNGALAYVSGDLVTSGGGVYMAILGSIGVEPPNATFWQSVAVSGGLSPHAGEHVTGADQIPTATTVSRGLMDGPQVTSLEGLDTRVSDLETPDPGSTTIETLEAIANNTLLGNDSGGAASPQALTVSEVVAMLDLDGSAGMSVVTVLGSPGLDSNLVSEQAIREAIDLAFVTGASDVYEEVADTTALKAVDMTAQNTPAIGFVTGTGLYFYDPDSLLTENIPSVVAPTTGGGAWVRTSTPLTNHDSLTGLAGTGPEYNHLTDAQVTKLTGVESGATADMSGAEIKVAYEGEADTNAFSDAYKAQLDNLTISGAVDLDALETQVATNVSDIATNASDLSTHIGDTANPHAVSKAQVGLSNVLDTLHNFTASVAPTATDDSGDGYSKGSLWIYGTEAWYCADATAGSAVWTPLTAESADQLDGQNGAFYLSRANHTGTQNASTISDFASAVATTLASTSVTIHSDVTNAGSGAIITAAERAKLVGIEISATADQTASEIKSLYESNADTNAFTDTLKSKLEGLTTSPGDMMAVVYDPNSIEADVFDPANHVYDNVSSGLTATNVQAALDEVAASGGAPGGVSGDLQLNDGAGGFATSALNEDATGGTVQAAVLDVTGADLNMGGGALLNYFDTTTVLATNGTVAWNHALHKDATLAPSGAVTLSLTGTIPVGAVSVNTLTITDGDTNITWPAGAVWIGTGGAAPTLQASGVDVVTIRATSSAVYLFHAGASV